MTVPMLKTLSEFLGEGFELKGKLHFFFVGGTVFRRRRVIHVGPKKKVFFFVLLSSNGGKIFFSITCIIFEVDENKVDQSLIFSSSILGTSYFAGQNDQLRPKSSKAALKAFSNDLSVAEDEVEDVVHLES